MHYKKIFVLISLCLAIGFWGCSSEGKKAEAPKQEKIMKSLVPANAEIRGQNLSAKLSDLKTEMTVDIASKEIIDTPSLTGHIIVTNMSKDIVDIQAATLEYLDEAGKPIIFKSGEKISKVSSYWLKMIKPGESVEGSVNATIPRAAVKDKALGKIEINLVYVPSPLRRETLTLSEKIE
jgi:hypothetical protein